MAAPPSFHANINPNHLPINPASGYRAQWRQYALRSGLAKALVFLWPVVAVGAAVLAALGLLQPEVAFPVALLWLALAYAAVWWAGQFRCPRCSRRYGALGSSKGSGSFWRGLFNSICSNCKLQKYTEG